MDTRAVYIIREDGKEFYFYSKYAGGFSYPFEAADFLVGLKNALQKTRTGKQDICAAPLLVQMKGTYFFPDTLQDELLFTETTKEIAQDMAEHIPFFITVDVERETVAFHFNDRFQELESLADVTLPCSDPENKYSGVYFRNESLARQMGKISRTFQETNEMIFRELIEHAAEEQVQDQSRQTMWGYYE